MADKYYNPSHDAGVNGGRHNPKIHNGPSDYYSTEPQAGGYYSTNPHTGEYWYSENPGYDGDHLSYKYDGDLVYDNNCVSGGRGTRALTPPFETSRESGQQDPCSQAYSDPRCHRHHGQFQDDDEYTNTSRQRDSAKLIMSPPLSNINIAAAAAQSAGHPRTATPLPPLLPSPTNKLGVLTLPGVSALEGYPYNDRVNLNEGRMELAHHGPSEASISATFPQQQQRQQQKQEQHERERRFLSLQEDLHRQRQQQQQRRQYRNRKDRRDWTDMEERRERGRERDSR